ncbi:MAG: 3'(2'),5'-bisphosphate nucleotidase [Acidiferrobacteraceae bacterium]|nr:3'(2'),5'-bisphosphate nucleotidase [Acidiferrobacteraceae bacterium]
MAENDFLLNIVDVAKQAGLEIMRIYESKHDYKVEYKDDGSPVTIADMLAHELICEHLAKLTPNIPILSEEFLAGDPAHRLISEKIWLVDPLDGTKEFMSRNGEFTVNIALIDRGAPTIGVVHAPALGLMYFAAQKFGAWRQANEESPKTIRTKSYDGGRVRMATSRSHSGQRIKLFQSWIEGQTGSEVRCTPMGSSLKICLVAEGRLDIYPRLGSTSEWDTAAAHCVLNEAGGAIIDSDGNALVYNKAQILNPWFFAIGDESHNWLEKYSQAKA